VNDLHTLFLINLSIIKFHCFFDFVHVKKTFKFAHVMKCIKETKQTITFFNVITMFSSPKMNEYPTTSGIEIYNIYKININNIYKIIFSISRNK